MTPTEALDAALEVRRGRKKIADFVDDETRKLVYATLRSTPEHVLADRARFHERPASKPFTFTRHFQ